MQGGKREGAGRKKGVTKTKTLFGYKYTEKEYKFMKEALEKIKLETGKTTSKILLDLLKNEMKL